MPLAMAARKCRGGFSAGRGCWRLAIGPYATDAQHVSVEFIHPMIVGKRALPALDLSSDAGGLAGRARATRRHRDGLRAARGRRSDPPMGRRGVAAAECSPTNGRDISTGTRYRPSSDDPFIHQELTELMYHALWETVHVFFEQTEKGDDLGAASFLYPLLARGDSSSDRYPGPGRGVDPPKGPGG